MMRLTKKFNFTLAGAALALGAVTGTAFAWNTGQVPLDFLTGGGWITHDDGSQANFGVGGGVKNGDWWGHLNYVDHENGLHVTGTAVTAYMEVDDHTREICGEADTDLYGPVDYDVVAADNGEPGEDDTFVLTLGQGGVTVYTTTVDSDHTLGGSAEGGGNIQLHAGNPSNTAPTSTPICNI
ncbi:MAG: post-COAP-1 domain-containing protein [Bacillota bacterium]